MRRHLARKGFWRLAIAVALCAAAACGQAFFGGVLAQSRPQAPAVDQRSTIRVEVNLVNLLASVLDRNNRPAPDLQREQFEVFEEGKLQKIELFETETQQPLDLV